MSGTTHSGPPRVLVPASPLRRAWGRVLDLWIGSAVISFSAVVGAWGWNHMEVADDWRPQVALYGATGAVALWLLVELVCLLRSGNRVGGLVAGVRHVSPDTGAIAGRGTLLKVLVQGALATVSGGLADPVVSLVTSRAPEHRSWPDRVAQLLAVHWSASRAASDRALTEPTHEPAPEPPPEPSYRRSPRPAGEAPAPVVPKRQWKWSLDGGDPRVLTDPVVIGRKPVPPAEAPDSVPSVVVDPDMRVSKTHLVLGYTGNRAWVLDAHSSNGTRVVGAAGDHVIPPGEHTPLSAGDVVVFGQHRAEVWCD